MKLFALIPIAAAFLAGCSSAPYIPEYRCPLNDSATGKCASVEDAYKASKAYKASSSANTQSVFQAQQDAPQPQQPFFKGESSNYPEPGQNGMPVFQQPKVMRAWVAPYVDADGNLRSGEYTYFNTPGQWNYGDLKKAGNASGIFEPSKKSKLGFTPNFTDANKKQATTGRTSEAQPPLSPTAPAKPAQPGSQGTGPESPAATTDNITQPYQRLSVR